MKKTLFVVLVIFLLTAVLSIQPAEAAVLTGNAAQCKHLANLIKTSQTEMRGHLNTISYYAALYKSGKVEEAAFRGFSISEYTFYTDHYIILMQAQNAWKACKCD